MVVSEITLFNTLREKLGEKEAQIVVEGIKSAVREEFDVKKDILATKQDLAETKSDLNRSIYVVGLVQYLAILASLIALLKFME